MEFPDLVLDNTQIVPLSQTTEGDFLLEKHIQSLQRLIEKIFGCELATKGELSEQLPLVKWNDCQKAPGALVIYLLTTSRHCRDIHHFFKEVVAHRLVPGDQLHILSSRNLTFQLKESTTHSYYFVELLLHVENGRQLTTILQHLPGLERELRLGSLSKEYAEHLLEMKRLPGSGNTPFIYERVVKLMKRYPKQFRHDIFREIQYFLVHCREDFTALRSISQLSRIICSLYLFHKRLQQDIKAYPGRRHLYLKLFRARLHYPIGFKKILGLTIALNSLREYECFEERHIQKAVQRLLPQVQVVQDTFYTQHYEQNKIRTLYLELEKRNREEFTSEELLILRNNLADELKNSIEYLSPSLFIPRNEEELYRNIIALSQELKYVHDLPQAIISFHEQHYDVLRFNVILLRLVRDDATTPSLQELSQRLAMQEHFIQERVTSVGVLRKKYTKEANVFSIAVDSHLFLRKNHSVNLLRARQYVVKIIEKLVGNFRDYNGGFLLKQSQQLESIKKELGAEGKQHEYLVENLFYSLTPSIMQTLVPPHEGRILSSLFLNAVEKPLSKQREYACETQFSEGALAVVIKSKQSDLKDLLAETIKKLVIDPFKLTSAMIELDGYYYVCYLYFNAKEEETTYFLQLIQMTLDAWVKSQLNLQIVRVHLPRATRSLDPRIGGDRTSGIVIKMLYEGLTRIDHKTQVELAIAEQVAISNDEKRYTFTLKESVWSNGSPLTAYDFEYAWKKILDPTFKSPYSFLLFPIKNAEKVKMGELPLEALGIQVIDEKRLVVELEYRAPFFLGLVAHWSYSPLCREIDQRHPGWAYHSAETHLSNGPFKLEIWKPNDNLEVVKNPLYWDAKSVKLDKVEIKIIEDDMTAFQMFKRGELDWFGDPMNKIPLSKIEELKRCDELHVAPLTGFFWLQLNTRHIPFSNRKIRHAFAYAINRRSLIKDILQGEDNPALGFYREQGEPLKALFNDNDIENAKRLFAEGLKELGMTQKELPSIIFTHSEVDEHEALTRAIGRGWEEILGVKVKYERVLWNKYFAALCNNQDYMVGGLSWYSRHEDPLYYLDLLVYREGMASPTTHWKNQQFNDLIAQARHEPDKHKQKAIIEEAENIVIYEMPVIPILFDNWRYLKNPRLKDLILSPINQIDLRNAYLENQ